MVSSVIVTRFFQILLSILILTFLAGMQHIYLFHWCFHMCIHADICEYIHVCLYVHTHTRQGDLPISAQILFEFQRQLLLTLTFRAD